MGRNTSAENLREKCISDIISTLGEDKEQVLDRIQSAVAKNIAELKERTISVTVAGTEYGFKKNFLKWIPRFSAFLSRKETYEYYTISTPVVTATTDAILSELKDYYGSKGDKIADSAGEYVLANDKLRKSLANAISDTATAKLGTQAIAHTISDRIQDFVAPLVTGTVVNILSTTTGKLVLKQVLIHSKAIVAHVVASKSFTIMMKVAMKKFIVAAVIGITTKIAATTFGAKIAAAIGSVVVPVIGPIVIGGIIAWLIHELVTFPRKLGYKVSEEVRRILSDKFDETNSNVASSIIEAIEKEIGTLGANIALELIKEHS